jgi:hypothetical protein
MTKKGKVGRKPALPSRRPKKNLPPAGETEAAQGTYEDVQPTPPLTVEAAQTQPAEREDDDFIPDVPPVGMQPMNDIVKRLIGTPPYQRGATQQEKVKFIQSTMDVGLLRELAIFEKPGALKDLAKKKLRLAKAQMDRPVRV